MIRTACRLRVPLLLLGLTTAPLASAAESALQPYQMVRSLQLVQDSIASGDHAALPMQNKLLEMIDTRLRETDSQDFADPRNFRATLIYAMSGGNPATIEGVFRYLDLDETNAKLADGIMNYLRGRRGRARISLSKIEPLSIQPELGAFVALVKASITSAEDKAEALRLFDQARLLGAGTLVEEAALRRSISLAATLGDDTRFLRFSGQYARRFLRSPYAAQFAEAFINGLIVLHASVDPKAVEEITAGMDSPQRQYIYLQLARRAAIEGFGELSAFAAEKARLPSHDQMKDPDPRALLYSSLASVTSETVDTVLERLKNIDRMRLSESDRRLLDAAATIAAEVTVPPGPDRAGLAEAGNVPSSTAAAGDLPMAGAAAVNAGSHAAAPSGQGQTAEIPQPPNAQPPEEMISEARKKLKAVDDLLGAAQ
jgi:chemotaxis protein MotC